MVAELPSRRWCITRFGIFDLSAGFFRIWGSKTWSAVKFFEYCGDKVLLQIVLHTARENRVPIGLGEWDGGTLRSRGFQSRGITRPHKPISNMLYLGIGIMIGTAIGSSVTLLLVLLLVAR